MRKIQIVDVSLREQAACNGSSLSFKEKIEVARQLDKLNVDAIETAPIVNGKNDIVFLHTLAPLMTRCILACPVGLDPELLPDTWEALRAAKRPRLNVVAPVSTVQMEYQFHKKPPVVLDTYQANRLKCRYRNSETKKTELCHTLNGSALALPRIVAALLENNQTENGIKIPAALVPYMGCDIID